MKLERTLELEQGLRTIYEAVEYTLFNTDFAKVTELIYTGVYVKSNLPANEFKLHWIQYYAERTGRLKDD